MLKISETQVGQTVTIPLLVKEAQIKQTGAGKPYLFVEFTDGSETLKGQEWNWGDKPALEKNSVFNVRGQISEYMGKKQIKIVDLQPSLAGVELFAPKGNVDVDIYTGELKQLINIIEGPITKQLVRDVFNDHAEQIKVMPAAKGMHHAYVHGLLEHTVNVTHKAIALAALTPMTNMDLIVSGALLHDIGKLRSYVLNGAVIDMTNEGMFLEHIMLGAMMLDKYRTPENSDILDLILHIVSSHHGVLEYGSPTTPRFLEAVIVHYADVVDAQSQMIIEVVDKTKPETEWTDKIWALGNRPVLNPSFIEKIFNTERLED